MSDSINGPQSDPLLANVPIEDLQPKLVSAPKQVNIIALEVCFKRTLIIVF